MGIQDSCLVWECLKVKNKWSSRLQTNDKLCYQLPGTHSSHHASSDSGRRLIGNPMTLWFSQIHPVLPWVFPVALGATLFLLSCVGLSVGTSTVSWRLFGSSKGFCPPLPSSSTLCFHRGLWTACSSWTHQASSGSQLHPAVSSVWRLSPAFLTRPTPVLLKAQSRIHPSKVSRTVTAPHLPHRGCTQCPPMFTGAPEAPPTLRGWITEVIYLCVPGQPCSVPGTRQRLTGGLWIEPCIKFCVSTIVYSYNSLPVTRR